VPLQRQLHPVSHTISFTTSHPCSDNYEYAFSQTRSFTTTCPCSDNYIHSLTLSRLPLRTIAATTKLKSHSRRTCVTQKASRRHSQGRVGSSGCCTRLDQGVLWARCDSHTLEVAGSRYKREHTRTHAHTSVQASASLLRSRSHTCNSVA